MKPILCVDFDNVLHSYDNGWQGANVVNDGPVPGAIQWLAEATKHFRVCIYSSRTKQPGGVAAMQQAIYRWVQEELDMTPPWLSEIEYPRDKPPAFLTIDDRAIRFEGSFDDLRPEDLLEFKTWKQQEQRELKRIHDEGYAAFEKDQGLSDNPYQDTVQHAQWEAGWIAAHDHYSEDSDTEDDTAPESDSGSENEPISVIRDREGRAAHEQGTPFEACPYDDESYDAFHWRQGWADAAKDLPDSGADNGSPDTMGARAFDDGKPLSACPFEPDSDEAVGWEGGWMEAEEASQV